MKTRVFCIESDLSVVVSIDWLPAFAGHLEATGCSARTIKSYLEDVRAFAAWFLVENGQPFSPDLLTGVDLRAYRQFALETKISPATFNRRRVTLARLAAWAMQTGCLTYNPIEGVDRLAEGEQAPRWLTPKETHRLLRQLELQINGSKTTVGKLQAIRDHAVVALMLYAGLREDEVSRLDVEDLTLSERKGKVIVRRGKGDKRREVPLSAEARRALRLWLELCGRSTGPLFVGKHGERLGAKGIQDRVAAVRRAAGLEDHVTPHTLRHTFAKRLLDGGAELTEVGRLLGHARLETTARYVQPGWDDLERAVEKF